MWNIEAKPFFKTSIVLFFLNICDISCISGHGNKEIIKFGWRAGC